MPNTPKSPAESVYGFLTVLEDPAAGMVGGLLMLDHRGRPLEFHCTTPIQPTRADEILCGATLRPMFYCERLGAALLAKIKAPPSLLFVNHVDLWPIAEHTTSPVILVREDEQEQETEAQCDTAQSVASLDRLPPESRQQVQERLDELERYIELTEPFDRIVEAIHETGMLSEQESQSVEEGEDPYDLAA